MTPRRGDPADPADRGRDERRDDHWVELSDPEDRDRDVFRPAGLGAGSGGDDQYQRHRTYT